MGNLTFNGGINYTIVFYRNFFRDNISVAIKIFLLQENLFDSYSTSEQILQIVLMKQRGRISFTNYSVERNWTGFWLVE